MAISHVSTGTFADENAIAGTTGIVVPKPASLANGDVMYLFTHRNSVVGTFNAISGDANWVEIIQNNEAGGEDRGHAVYRKVVTNASGEPSNYTLLHTDTGTEQMAAVIVAYRGVDNTTPEDVTVVDPTHLVHYVNSATTNADAANPITTVTNGAVVIVFEAATNQSITSDADPSGYTNRARNYPVNHRNIQVWDITKATAGVETPGAAAWTASDTTTDTSYITMALRPAAAGSVTVTACGPADLGVIFDNELRVEIDGTEFGAVQGTGGVTLNDTDPETTTPGTTVAQTIRSWSDTLISIDVDIGALTAGTVWLGVDNDSGASDSLAIEIKADGGASVVSKRQDPFPADQDIADGTPFSFDASTYLFASDVQDKLTFSAAALPTGLSITSAGVISGTISNGAAASSPFATQITATDQDGNTAVDNVTWTVGDNTPSSSASDNVTARNRRVSIGAPMMGRR